MILLDVIRYPPTPFLLDGKHMPILQLPLGKDLQNFLIYIYSLYKIWANGLFSKVMIPFSLAISLILKATKS